MPATSTAATRTAVPPHVYLARSADLHHFTSLHFTARMAACCSTIATGAVGGSSCAARVRIYQCTQVYTQVLQHRPSNEPPGARRWRMSVGRRGARMQAFANPTTTPTSTLSMSINLQYMPPPYVSTCTALTASFIHSPDPRSATRLHRRPGIAIAMP
jgi:hypothetical protein